MSETAKARFHVTLMGRPLVTGREALDKENAQRINADADATELMALLLLLPLSNGLPQADHLKPGVPHYLERERLVTTLYPDLFAQDAKKARDKLHYVLRKLNSALQIRRRNAGGLPEHGEISVTLAHLSIDVREILSAARHPHEDAHRETVIARGEQRLLEGMGYPWLDQPTFRELRQSLDESYLKALCLNADELIFKMESAARNNSLHEAVGYRRQALTFLEMGRKRIGVLDASHPLARQFSGLQARAAQLPFASEAAKPSAPAHNIPRRVTSFVGRKAEMAKLNALLSTERIVTITGMGGCGKTRLALQAALAFIDRTGDEAWLVELAGVADPTLVAQAVAHVLGLPEPKQRTYTDALVDRFRTRRALLLLDNCEHLLAECAALVEKLTQFCPDLTVLATSRQRLNIDGECPVRLATLRVPPADPEFWTMPDPVCALLEYEAAQLFVDRIRQGGDFTVLPQHVAAIASVCASLDGIPLALELAAARTDALSLIEIEDLLSDRFHLLTSGRVTAPSRHKTLRAVIDWSYDLLTEREQALLCRLSVFAGGWTLEAAQFVGASGEVSDSDVLDVLTSLVDKSLVVSDPAVSPGRFRMLETVRQYAGDQLRERGMQEETRLQHRSFFAALAAEAHPHLAGPEPGPWLDRLDSELDNLRLALEWKADQEGMRLACHLRSFWQIRSHFQEGRRWLELAWEDSVDLPIELRAHALVGAGALAFNQSHFQEAERLCRKSLHLSAAVGDPVGMADALYHLGCVATHQGDYREAENRLQESLALSLASGNERSIADAHHGLGRLAHVRNDYICADEHFTVCLRLWRSLGDAVKLAMLLSQMGLHAAQQDRRAEARALLTESLALQSRFGSPQRHGQVLAALAELARIEGDHAETRSYGEQSMVYLQQVGDRIGIANMMNTLALVAMEEGDFPAAEKGFEQSRAILLSLGNERFATAISVNLASAVGKQGEYGRSISLFQESLVQLHRLDAWQWIGNVMEEMGLLEASRKPGARAVTLLIAADTLLEQTGYCRTDAEKQRRAQALDVLRAALGVAVFESACHAGRAMTQEQACAFALA